MALGNTRIYRVRLYNGDSYLVVGDYTQEAEENFLKETGLKNQVTSITPLGKVVRE